GGMQRWFEPVAHGVVQAPGWQALLRGIGAVCSALKGERAWFIEAHQFRIDTSNGIGRPTPEGAHRDGVDLVAVLLVARQGVKGGETRVFDADGPGGQRFTLIEPWTLLLLDDARVIHETTPIQPLQPGTASGWRDTLVLTWRAGGFQGD
ncbi:MAG: 2OG-Fe dioxygenase family protein, partial [Rhodoferax sp.]